MATTATSETFETEVLESRRQGDRRLLGRVVWPVPRRLAGARPDRRRARREDRQGEHRRAAGSRAALRRRVDPVHGAVRERRAAGVRNRRHAEGLAREGAGSGGGWIRLQAFSRADGRALSRLVHSQHAHPVHEHDRRRRASRRASAATKPTSVSRNGPSSGHAPCNSSWPKIAASKKKTVAVTIADHVQRRGLPERAATGDRAASRQARSARSAR